jgi:hypothetical protein
MATMVRNRQPGPTTFSDDSTGQKPVVWQGRGDVNHQDVRPVPSAFLESVAFQQALETGIFEIVASDEEAARIREAHRAQFQSAQYKQQHLGDDVLDHQPDNDMLVKECIGPNGKSGKPCGEQVTVASRELNSAPPLCNKHRALRSQFVPVETGRVVAGRPEVMWTRPRLGQPVKSTEE